MSLLSNTGIRAGASGAGGAETTAVGTKSLRFNSDDTTTLTRTPSSAGNRKTWTWSAWIKRVGLGKGGSNTEEVLFASNGNSDATNAQIQFGEDDDLQLLMGYPSHDLKTSAEYRDCSQWYHFVVAVDVTQGTASNKVKIYVNGVQETAFDTDQRSDYADQDWAINQADSHKIGNKGDNNRPFDGYMSNICFVDGLQLTPSSFGETNATTQQWVPKVYDGTYGTNGFFLTFADNSATTAAALGKDTSGNGHNWTPNNFSVSAGGGNDVLLDSPVDGDSSSDTGAGGQISANYPTINPLWTGTGYTFAHGSLVVSNSGGWYTYLATQALPKSGKYYWECRRPTATWLAVGITDGLAANTSYGSKYACQYVSNHGNLDKKSDGTHATTESWGDTWTATSDIIGVAVDMDNEKIWFAKNNTWQDTSGTPNPATGADPAMSGFGGYDMFPHLNIYQSMAEINFGQRPFENNAPSGFKCLCSANYPTPTIVKPNEHFDVALYTGTGSGLTVSSLAFQPDFTWIKSRSSASHNHLIYDDIRGSTKYLSSNSDGHGDTATLSWTPTSTGFTISTNSNYNTNNDNYVSWNWKAATSQGNSNGANITVASGKQQVNTTAGFSITEYEGDGSGNADSDSGDSVGHGLSKTPEWVVLKRFNSAQNNWICWHTELGAAKHISMNTNNGRSGTNYCVPTVPTSTAVDLGNNPEVNASGHDYMMYCWHGVDGFSKFGTYEGGTVGTFVYTGFQPRLVWVKNSDYGPSDWSLMDSARETFNPNNNWLPCNHNGPEGQQQSMFLLSNGFMLNSTSGGSNKAGHTYIYMAWAKHPFKYSRAR